jgi:hypothetical protein
VSGWCISCWVLLRHMLHGVHVHAIRAQLDTAAMSLRGLAESRCASRAALASNRARQGLGLRSGSRTLFAAALRHACATRGRVVGHGGWIDWDRRIDAVTLMYQNKRLAKTVVSLMETRPRCPI